MIKNRSVPADIILPHIAYRNVALALDWLTKTFGFVEHYRYGDPDEPQGAQMCLGGAWIMLGATEGQASPAETGDQTQSLTIFVEDVEDHFQTAKAVGAKIVEEPHETVYGEFQFAVEDFEGHLWLFSRHVRDVSPEEWGAKVARS